MQCSPGINRKSVKGAFDDFFYSEEFARTGIFGELPSNRQAVRNR